jgi:formyl-CoA transferase
MGVDRSAAEAPFGALAGLRVVEVGAVVAGPFAGRMLADQGAEVIKVEAPDKPDQMREWGRGNIDGRSFWWPIQARNKRLVTIDLRRHQGQELFLELIQGSDVLIENMRPSTLERWNLAPARMQEINPGLIIARVSGFGQSGPYAPRTAYAAIGEAIGGLRYVNGFPDRPPPRFGVSLGDSLAALFATQGILAALYERQSSGLGQVVDASLMEACFAMLESAAPEYDRLGLVRKPQGTRLDGVAPSNTYMARDGRSVVIGANQDSLFVRLCRVMGQPELVDDDRYRTHSDRARNQDELDALVADWVAQHDSDELVTMLNDAGVASGPVYSIADIFEDPHYRAREALVTHHDPELGDFMGPGITPKLSRTPGDVRWTGPWEPGTDNDRILGSLPGMTAERMDQLREDGIV